MSAPNSRTGNMFKCNFILMKHRLDWTNIKQKYDKFAQHLSV